jgi:CheY-like chemotaxis protein
MPAMDPVDQELACKEAPALGKARIEILAQGSNELRVLVVEDNRDAAESLRNLLALCGYCVMVAYTAQQGLETASRLQPHIVLCDIGLPDSDGYVVASVLRQTGDTTRARLIAVTAHGKAQDRRRSLAAGFDLHLVKPVDPGVLLREVALGNHFRGAGRVVHMFG